MFLWTYITSIFHPQRIFKNHQSFSWVKMSVIFLIWTLIWLVPMTIHFTNLSTTEESHQFQEISSSVPGEALNQLKHAPKQGRGLGDETQTKQYQSENLIVSVMPPADDVSNLLEDHQNVILLVPEGFTIQVDYDKRYSASFPKDWDKHLDSSEDFINALDRAVVNDYQSNKQMIFLFGRHLVFLIFGIGGLFIIGSFFRRIVISHRWDIYNFEATMNIVGLALGVPAFLATILGLFKPNIVMMLIIIWGGTVTQLYYSYKKTGFKNNFN